ncbi:MAG: hypothetical protein NVS3B5_01410 [Sphingomicrobium sp.]
MPNGTSKSHIHGDLLSGLDLEPGRGADWLDQQVANLAATSDPGPFVPSKLINEEEPRLSLSLDVGLDRVFMVSFFANHDVT